MLSRYRVDYIVKTTNEVGFSEGASFRDILFVATKQPPDPQNLVRVVFLRERLGVIEGRSQGRLQSVARAIQSGTATNEVEFRDFPQSEMIAESQDLMGFIGASSGRNLDVLRKTLDALRKQPSIKPFPRRYLSEGFGARPQGLAGLIYVMRDRDTPSRFTRSLLKLGSVHRDTIEVLPLNPDLPVAGFSFPREKTTPAVRNLVGQDTIDISGKTDYILRDSYPGLKMLSSVSSWSGTQRGRGLLTKERASPESLRLGSRTAAVSSFLTNLALLHRFDPTTPNSKVVAVWSREKFVPNNNMFIVDVAGNLGKALAVYLNSSFSIAQFLLHKQETTRTLIDIKISDLEGFMAPDPDRIEPTVIQGLARVFDTFSDSTLGSIIEDYTSG
ncbi:N-6 DNA Methylase family, partial [mine drainage metagenome]